MPSSLKRYQHSGADHFLTFSCYRRLALFRSDHAKQVFESNLEQIRRWYGFYVYGYVVMPEHVHLLVSEPLEKPLYSAIQMLKQLVSRKLPHMSDESPFWEPRYYDFNVFTRKKWTEKLQYLHRNPVTRGLVANPEDWPWSSYRHWLTGDEGILEIESHWTFSRRERMGIETSFGRANEGTPSHPALSPTEGE